MRHTRTSLYAYVYMSILVCVYTNTRIVHVLRAHFGSLISERHCKSFKLSRNLGGTPLNGSEYANYRKLKYMQDFDLKKKSPFWLNVMTKLSIEALEVLANCPRRYVNWAICEALKIQILIFVSNFRRPLVLRKCCPLCYKHVITMSPHRIKD